MSIVKHTAKGHGSIDPEFVFDIEMEYDSTDPVAVRFTFSSEETEPVTWEFARSLLNQSVTRSAGSGDVVLTASGDRLSILLRSPNGSIIMELPLRDVVKFLEDTHRLVSEEEEGDVVDKNLEAFLYNGEETR